MSAYGTVTCLAPAGHHPPKPSRQTRSFMKKPSRGSRERFFVFTLLYLRLRSVFVFFFGEHVYRSSSP